MMLLFSYYRYVNFYNVKIVWFYFRNKASHAKL